MSAFRAILRTSVLSAGAGLVFYLGLAAFPEGVRQPHLWLTLVLGGAGLVLFAHEAFAALRAGEAVAGRFVVYRRDRQPLGFWLSVGFLGAMGLCLLVVLACAAWRLAAEFA
ncbi:MAG: hypothetical protein J0H53_01275 [Rhizobiales bacterium]|nr:hypothetical protein [Hyphomicrobiales bacterium]